LAGGSSC